MDKLSTIYNLERAAKQSFALQTLCHRIEAYHIRSAVQRVHEEYTATIARPMVSSSTMGNTDTVVVHTPEYQVVDAKADRGGEGNSAKSMFSAASGDSLELVLAKHFVSVIIVTVEKALSARADSSSSVDGRLTVTKSPVVALDNRHEALVMSETSLASLPSVVDIVAPPSVPTMRSLEELFQYMGHNSDSAEEQDAADDEDDEDELVPVETEGLSEAVREAEDDLHIQAAGVKMFQTPSQRQKARLYIEQLRRSASSDNHNEGRTFDLNLPRSQVDNETIKAVVQLLQGLKTSLYRSSLQYTSTNATLISDSDAPRPQPDEAVQQVPMTPYNLPPKFHGGISYLSCLVTLDLRSNYISDMGCVVCILLVYIYILVLILIYTSMSHYTGPWHRLKRVAITGTHEPAQ